MSLLAHKTDSRNLIQTMRFHPFVSTGKEKDEETGYGYFGARYMDHELTTMWLSVDPMADKYPGISPYNYCMWNPIKLVDPDGRDTAICYTPSEDNNKTMNYDRRHYSYNRSDILHYCSHGFTDHLSPYGFLEYPDETAEFIMRNNKEYKIIVLHACWVGNWTGCFAEQLSKIIPDALIFAPSQELAVSDKNDFEEVINNGFWNVFRGGRLVNSCSGGREDTKALEFIWRYISFQDIIELFSQNGTIILQPQVIVSNYINQKRKGNEQKD